MNAALATVMSSGVTTKPWTSHDTRLTLVTVGGIAMPEYQEAKWADAAFIEQVTDLKQKIAILMEEKAGMAGDVLDFGTRMACT